MTQLFRYINQFSFILLFTIAGCEGPAKEKCDAECKKCIADCYGRCEEGFKYCLKVATSSNKSTYENCPYYGNQCLLSCPEKCVRSEEKK